MFSFPDLAGRRVPREIPSCTVLLKDRFGATYFRIESGNVAHSEPDATDLVVDAAGAHAETSSVDESTDAWGIGALELLVGKDSGQLSPLPPYDLMDLSWTAQLERLSHVDAVWTTHHPAAGLGDLSVTYDVREGIPVAVSPGTDDRAEAVFTIPWIDSVRARAGIIGPIQGLGSAGSLEGSLDLALLIGGLIERADWRLARHIDAHRYSALHIFYVLASTGLFVPLPPCPSRSNFTEL